MEKLQVSAKVKEALDNLLGINREVYPIEYILTNHANSKTNYTHRWQGETWDYLNELTLEEMAQAIYVGYMIKYPEIQEGDIVISTEEHSCDMRFVEGADEECILLVDGKRDRQYILPEETEKFWSEWKILCKKEDRKDTEEESS